MFQINEVLLRMSSAIMARVSPCILVNSRATTTVNETQTAVQSTRIGRTHQALLPRGHYWHGGLHKTTLFISEPL